MAKYQSIGEEKHEREREREHDASVFPDGASVLQRVTGPVLTRTPFHFHPAINFTDKNTKYHKYKIRKYKNTKYNILQRITWPVLTRPPFHLHPTITFTDGNM